MNLKKRFRPLSGFYKFLLEKRRQINAVKEVSVPYRGSISFYPVAWIAFIAMLFHWICGGKEKHRKSMKKLLFKLL